MHCIVSDLHIIHSQGIIHRDLHSGNILLSNLYSAYVADLGLATVIAIEDKICGILPYIAPEILKKHSYTTISDIYSFGIIMWEISTGQRPFDDEPCDIGLAIKICNGLKLKFISGTPKCYVELANQCMDPNPEKRPTAEEISSILNEWNKDIESSNEFEIKKQFLDADKISMESSIFTPVHTDYMNLNFINTKKIALELQISGKMSDRKSVV